MWPFNGDGADHVQEQIDLHEEIIAEKSAELDELEGSDSPEAQKRCKELREQIRQSKLSISQAKEGAERAGHEVGRYERDNSIFGD